MNEEFKRELKQELAKSSTEQRTIWSGYILKHELDIQFLLDILLLEPPASTRFSWLLGGLSSIDNRYTLEIIAFGFRHLEQIQIPDIKRVLLKQCALTHDNFPEHLEGEVLNYAFQWLEDPQSSISTKEMAMKTLQLLCKKYPQIIPEFKLTLKACLPAESKSLERKVRKVLNDS